MTKLEFRFKDTLGKGTRSCKSGDINMEEVGKSLQEAKLYRLQKTTW